MARGRYVSLRGLHLRKHVTKGFPSVSGAAIRLLDLRGSEAQTFYILAALLHVMSQAIFVSKGGEGFVKCEPFEVESEERLRQLLEKLIEENVDIILPTPKGREPFKLVFLTREFGVPSGSIDLLGVDDEGYIYVIETKLYRSSERRRALAQVLDYASALWSKYSRSPDSFIAELERRSSIAPEGRVPREEVKESLKYGSFRLVIAMDRIDEAAKSMIDFLNETSEFDVYGLSLEVYRSDEGLEVVVPRLYPQSPPEPVRPSTTWSWSTFLEDARKRVPDYIRALEDVYRFSLEITKGRGGLRWGAGKKYGSFVVYFDNLFGGRTVFGVSSNGLLTIYFANLYPQELSDEASKKAAEVVDKFAERLYKAGLLKERVSRGNYREAGKMYPSVRVEQWASKVDEFKEAVKELVSSV
jgi:hypothetical protein